MSNSPRISVAGLLIGISGFCLVLAAVPAFIGIMGGFPDPAHDFLGEILMFQLGGVCCVVGFILSVTVVGIAFTSPKRRKPK